MIVFEELRKGKSLIFVMKNISARLTAKLTDAGISAGRSIPTILPTRNVS